MVVHELKILPEYFEAIMSGKKTFEIRENDRSFKIGDFVLLLECSSSNEYTGRNVFVEIVYLTDFAQKNNYVVFSFQHRPRNYIKVRRGE